MGIDLTGVVRAGANGGTAAQFEQGGGWALGGITSVIVPSLLQVRSWGRRRGFDLRELCLESENHPE